MEKLAKIYIIKNTENDMIYVGSTMLSLKERFSTHLRHAKQGREGALADDIRNQTEDSFRIKQIDECHERHRFIIEEYHWRDMNRKGFPLYDIKRGASHSKNTRQRIAKARQENGFNYSSEEFKVKMSLATSGENNGMFGRKDENAVNGRVVHALDKDGNVIHEFSSVKLALAFIGIKGHSKLNEACRTGKEYKGFFWKKEWIDR